VPPSPRGPRFARLVYHRGFNSKPLAPVLFNSSFFSLRTTTSYCAARGRPKTFGARSFPCTQCIPNQLGPGGNLGDWLKLEPPPIGKNRFFSSVGGRVSFLTSARLPCWLPIWIRQFASPPLFSTANRLLENEFYVEHPGCARILLAVPRAQKLVSFQPFFSQRLKSFRDGNGVRID